MFPNPFAVTTNALIVTFVVFSMAGEFIEALAIAPTVTLTTGVGEEFSEVALEAFACIEIVICGVVIEAFEYAAAVTLIVICGEEEAAVAFAIAFIVTLGIGLAELALAVACVATKSVGVGAFICAVALHGT